MPVRRKNAVIEEQVVLHLESAVQALASTSPVAASCILTADQNSGLADGDTVTIESGISKVIYEYDKSANGVTAGHVSVTAATTAATVAAAFRTAMLAAQPELTVVDNADGTLTITNKWLGSGGNQTNSKSSSSGVLAITNFTGGVDAAFSATLSATTTQKFHVAERKMRVDSVTALMKSTGVTANANDYWDIELKDGSTSMAKWSTHTGDQGTITANTPFTVPLSATKANRVAAAGDTLSLVVTKHGSPANLPAIRLTVNGHFVL